MANVQKRKLYIKLADGTIQEQLVASSADIVEVAPIEGLDGVTDVQEALEAIAGIATEGGVTGVKGDAEETFRKGQVNITKENIGLGNVTNDAQVKRSEMGQANGVATLDESGHVPSSQLPSYVDDTVEGYYDAIAKKFYIDSTKTTELTGVAGKIYVDLNDDKTYRWSGSTFVEISASLALGETSSTAYAGDKGKANAENITKLLDFAARIATDGVDDVTGIVNIAHNADNADALTNPLTVKLEGDATAEFNVQGGRKQPDGVTATVTLANSGVTAGTYSAVQVDAKGRVTAGNQIIEWGSSGQKTPTADLAVGGLFFELVE